MAEDLLASSSTPSCATRLAFTPVIEPPPSGGAGTPLGSTMTHNHHQHVSVARPSRPASDLDLPTYEQLTVLRSTQQGLHRPDSVITTSSIVSSDAGEEGGGRPAAPLPPMAALPNVYTISGLYGATADVSHSPSSSSSSASSEPPGPKTHKRSTSGTAASIMRSCQNMTHKRSHSHTVGYRSGSFHQHKRVSSAGGNGGFVAGHRRTASGALIEVLDKMTGGALEMQQTTTEFLKDIQRQNQVNDTSEK